MHITIKHALLASISKSNNALRSQEAEMFITPHNAKVLK